MVRQNNGRKEKTSFCIIDAQSVKNADTAEEKGYDAGKKISGIKRHIAVDTQGLPHAIYITTAEITDRSSAVRMVENAKENLSGVIAFLIIVRTGHRKAESTARRKDSNRGMFFLALFFIANQ